jgi:hypothetical protein
MMDIKGFPGYYWCRDLCAADIVTMAEKFDPKLIYRKATTSDCYAVEFNWKKGSPLNFSTYIAHGYEATKPQVIGLEFILIYASCFFHAKQEGVRMPKEAQRSYLDIHALLENSIIPMQADAFLELANELYRERPWFYRLCLAFDVDQS